jgi:hypothetical protein
MTDIDRALKVREGVRVGYYVSVINGAQRALILGPFETHAEALADVDEGRRLAERVDPFSGFYAFGTARVENPTLPEGKLNTLRESPK